MRPLLPRGQAPAKPDHVLDLRGYWLGQHTNPRRRKEREALRVLGRRQYVRHVKQLNRAAKEALE